MNIWDLVIIAIIAAVVIRAIIKIRRNKKSGGCSCGCGGCGMPCDKKNTSD